MNNHFRYSGTCRYWTK